MLRSSVDLERIFLLDTIFNISGEGGREWNLKNQIKFILLKLFLKMGHPLPLSSFIFGLFKQKLQFLPQYTLKSPPSTGIRTHDLLDVSLLPKPLYQGSRPCCVNVSLCPCLWQSRICCHRQYKLHFTGSLYLRLICHGSCSSSGTKHYVAISAYNETEYLL